MALLYDYYNDHYHDNYATCLALILYIMQFPALRFMHCLSNFCTRGMFLEKKNYNKNNFGERRERDNFQRHNPLTFPPAKISLQKRILITFRRNRAKLNGSLVFTVCTFSSSLLLSFPVIRNEHDCVVCMLCCLWWWWGRISRLKREKHFRLNYTCFLVLLLQLLLVWWCFGEKMRGFSPF